MLPDPAALVLVRSFDQLLRLGQRLSSHASIHAGLSCVDTTAGMKMEREGGPSPGGTKDT